MSRDDKTYQKQLIVIDGISVPLLTDNPASWSGSSLLSVSQITSPGLQLVLSRAQSMRTLVRRQQNDGSGSPEEDDTTSHLMMLLPHTKIVGTVFFEASTRTSCSFQAAALRLGARTLHVDGAAGSGNTSAAKKGESLQDTIACLQCYTDLIVLRHPVTGSVGKVIAMSQKPVLNAGDGVGEHPTQALLDVFTIYDELKLGRPSSTSASSVPSALTVVLLGDLKHGRTVHSLAQLLAATTRGILWRDRLTLRLCAPAALAMPATVRDSCAAVDGVEVVLVNDDRNNNNSLLCADAHVLYVTRIQRERFESDAEYESVKGSYVVDAEFMKQAPAEMMVLHPLPRVDEIATEVDSDPRAAYFRQMENGMFVRMALLALVLGKSSSS